MPIEVRELIIKAAFLDQDGSAKGGEHAAGGHSNNSITPKEEIIKACLERVMEILKEKHER
jgi:Family of unknown function (DUF5908)